MPDKVGQQIGNYRLVKLLGKGGFAEVYLGQHVLLASKQAAIKILHLMDVDVRKFQQEAETTEKLVHPHIVRLLDFAIEQGTPFLVLDYAPGGSLRSRHPKGSVVPLAQVGAYLKQITPALQYAHDRNILHRDIKPDNMLIGRQGELLISDFGLAVLSQTGRTSLQASYGIGGTPFYMAPEAYRGKPEKASDQYSLAIVVYEWLCGSVPFSEGGFIQLGYQHTHEPVPSLREKNPSLSSDVEAVILTALAKEPKDRFASVQAFAHALEQACQGAQPTVRVASLPVKPPASALAPTQSVVLVSEPIGTLLYTCASDSDSPVLTVAWSPDGKRIASARVDGTVLVWDAATGGHMYTYRGVYSVAWSPDGQRIASARVDGTVLVWDATDGGNVFNCKVDTKFVNALAWSPDGQRIASGGGDGTVLVWDATDGGNVFKYEGHTKGSKGTKSVNALVWSPDGQRIASGGSDRTVQVWSAKNGKIVWTDSHNQSFPDYVVGSWSPAVRAVAWSPDGQRIASGGDTSGGVWVQSAKNGGHLFRYKGHDQVRTYPSQGYGDDPPSSYACVFAVAWSPDGKRIASVGAKAGKYDHWSGDRTVQVWSAG